MQKTGFEAIGTQWTIEVFDTLPLEDWQLLMTKVNKRIEQFDKNYSRFRKDSLVSKMSRKAGRYQVPADGFKLIKFYEDLYRLSGGLVTPLIGQILVDAGYDATYSLKPKTLSSPPAWETVIKYDKKFVELHQPALLDFGAAGKGYLVDIIGDLLTDAGIKNWLINAGGDIMHRNTSNEAIKVGLENPLNTDQVIGIVSLNNQSLCASAGSRRQWQKYNHIFNPVKLESPSDVLATWVIAGNTMLADGLATALFFVKAEKLAKFDFAYAILDKNMSLNYSKNFNAEVFKT